MTRTTATVAELLDSKKNMISATYLRNAWYVENYTDNLAQTTWMGNLVDKTTGGQYAAYVLAPQINTASTKFKR